MDANRYLTGVLAGLLFCVGCCGSVEAKKKPDAALRDVKYILGLYYGNGENLLVREAGGELQLFYRLPGDRCFETANMYPLTKQRFDHYTLVEAGPMSRFGEVSVKFERDQDGYGVALKIGGHSYSRHFFPGEREGAEPYRLPERKDWDALRMEAARLSVPKHLATGAQEELTDLSGIAGLCQHSVYATSDNLFGVPLYTSSKLYLTRSAALALGRAQKELARQGYGLVVWDAYRPWSVSKLASLALPDNSKGMLENPDTEGSVHNTGRAVDVGLCDLKTGKVLEQISGFDEPSLRQYVGYPGGTELQRYYRDLLAGVMEKCGFKGVAHEWWHFVYKPEVRFAHLNLGLEDLQ